MGNGMNKVLPGLFVGSVRDSRDEEQIREHKITHILSIHDNPKRGTYDNVIYMCVLASDQPDQNLVQFFPQCNDFIHSARLNGGCVLIHCLAGVSRSITILIAYLMSVTSLNWKDALKCVRAARAIANPNLGFQKQLQEFEGRCLREEKRRLLQRYHEDAFSDLDEMEVKRLVTLYDSMQVTLRSRRRAAINNFATDGQQRPFTSSEHHLSSRSSSSSAATATTSRPSGASHSSSSPPRASSSSGSSSSYSFAPGSTRNYQLRRVNSSHLNYYSNNCDNSNVVKSPNTRRRSVTQLTGTHNHHHPHHFNSVTIRRASSTSNDEPNMSLLRIGNCNLRNESETSLNCLPPSRPSSTPIYSVSSGSLNHRSHRRRRQLPQCPEPNVK